MRIDTQGRFKGLQGPLQIAVADMDHAKPRQGTEMPGLAVDHFGDITARAIIITAHKAHRCPLVPCFGIVGMIIDYCRENRFGM